MKVNEKHLGSLMALVVVAIWGTTFISSKVLLRTFQPVEILFIRFAIGLAGLTAIHPGRLHLKDWRQQAVYAISGLTGVTLYYLLENGALVFTMASNVGIIIGTVPFFTAIVAIIFTKGREMPGWRFYLGFVVAFAGIIIISINGTELHMNPLGDLMTVGAAICWAVYTNILRKINSYGYDNLENTKRIFLWGMIFTVPAMLLMDAVPVLSDILQPRNLANLLYLGIGASAGGYVIWNWAVKLLGPVRCNTFLYLAPVITLVASALILGEPVTAKSLLGTGLIVAGLIISG